MDLVQLFTHFNAFYIRNVSFKQLVRHIFARFLFFFIFYLLNIKVLFQQFPVNPTFMNVLLAL